MARDPFRTLDDDARATTRHLLTGEDHAVLATLDPATGAPVASRIAWAWLEGAGHTLVSTLSAHRGALEADPRCSLLLGTPEAKGDPLTHPRLTLQAEAVPADKAALRDAWLRLRPKSTLYYDFTDFGLMRFAPVGAMLNGGFGKAYRLTPADLAALA
ncbi:MAG: pyridoxamine 5'-phosphate oxidase family protein [Shimia sp.]